MMTSLPDIGDNRPDIQPPERYGASVELIGDDECEASYSGLHADAFRVIALQVLGAGWGAIAVGRVNPDRPDAPPHKTPWHTGRTGYHGRDATADEIATWAENVVGRIAFGPERGVLGVGARTPVGVIGIDVDQYGDKHGLATIAKYAAKHGLLPPTFVLTARDYASGSGIRLFRVPEDFSAVGELDGGDVEIIQRHHRHVIPRGGLHHTGATYRLYGPDGDEITDKVVPHRDELPALPDAWLEALRDTGRKRRKNGRPATRDDLVVLVSEWDHNEYPDALGTLLDYVRRSAAEGKTRNPVRDALWIAAHKARAGCFPYNTAREAIKAAAIVAYADRGRELDVRDFDRMADGAVDAALDMPIAELKEVWGGERVPKRWRRRSRYVSRYSSRYQPRHRSGKTAAR